MTIRSAIPLVCLMVLATSCKEPEPGTGSSGVFAQLKAAYEDQLDFQCMCLVADGTYPDLASCHAEAGDPFEDLDVACFEDLVADPVYQPWVDCELDAEQAYFACLSAQGCVTDFACADGTEMVPGDWQCDGEPDCNDSSDELDCGTMEPSCDAAYFEACGDSPAGYEEAIDACIEQFVCTDGDMVPASWKCDGEADCVDGSDEVAC